VSIHDIDNFMPVLEEFAAQSACVIEIGLDSGDGSTVAFTRGFERSRASDKLYLSIDILPGYIKPEHYPPLPYWFLLPGDSRDRLVLERAKRLSGRWCLRPDLIFIDTDHTPRQIQAELDLWGCWLESMVRMDPGYNPIMLFHDTYMLGKYNPMTDTIKNWARTFQWIYSDYSTEPHGLGMIAKRK
jgi:hypothetical protein